MYYGSDFIHFHRLIRMASKPGMQHTHSASEALDHVTTNGGPQNEKSRPPGGMASKRNFSVPHGAFAKKQWKAAILKLKSLPDPWEGLVQNIIFLLQTLKKSLKPL